jgi:hypothetical protein
MILWVCLLCLPDFARKCFNLKDFGPCPRISLIPLDRGSGGVPTGDEASKVVPTGFLRCLPDGLI